MPIIRYSATATTQRKSSRRTHYARALAHKHMTIAKPSVWQRITMILAWFK